MRTGRHLQPNSAFAREWFTRVLWLKQHRCKPPNVEPHFCMCPQGVNTLHIMKVGEGKPGPKGSTYIKMCVVGAAPADTRT